MILRESTIGVLTKDHYDELEAAVRRSESILTRLECVSHIDRPTPKYRMRACDRAKNRRRGGKV